MNTQLKAGDILTHCTYIGHLVVTADQDAAGMVRIAIANVRELAKSGSRAVFALERIDDKNIEPLPVADLEAAGWGRVGVAVPSHTLDVACGRGGANVLDNSEEKAHSGANDTGGE